MEVTCRVMQSTGLMMIALNNPSASHTALDEGDGQQGYNRPWFFAYNQVSRKSNQTMNDVIQQTNDCSHV